MFTTWIHALASNQVQSVQKATRQTIWAELLHTIRSKLPPRPRTNCRSRASNSSHRRWCLAMGIVDMSQSLGSAPLINLSASLVSWSFWGMRWTSNLSRHVSFCNTTRGKKIIKPCSFPHVLVFNLGNYRTIPMWILAYLFWSKSTNQLQLSCLSVVVDQKNI